MDAPGVTIETDAGLPRFAVQKREPSKASPLGNGGRLLATSVTLPTGWLGSIVARVPGVTLPTTTTRPMAMRSPAGLIGPVHVSRSFPSLARTREMLLAL